MKTRAENSFDNADPQLQGSCIHFVHKISSRTATSRLSVGKARLAFASETYVCILPWSYYGTV